MITSKFNFESDKILSALTQKEKSRFLGVAKKLTFNAGKLVFYEGGIATGIFLMKSGRAKIYKTGFYGRDQIFYIYKRGDLLGYHALLCNEPYEDSCEALEDCELFFISKSDFNRLMNEIPKLSPLLIQNMSHEFGVLVNTITILAQKPLRQRLALYLLILQERYFDSSEESSKINLPREDLANIIGTSRESLGRLIKEFKEDGLITVNKRTLEIANAKKIEQLANT